MPTPRTRRFAGFVSLAAGASLALGGLGAPAGAQGTDHVLECPDGLELIAKYEWQNDSYVAETGGDVVSVTGDAEGGTWSSEEPIELVIINGGNDSKQHEPGDPYAGSFDNEGLQAGESDQTAGISNLLFCGDVDDGNGDNGNGENGNGDNGNGDNGNGNGDNGNGVDETVAEEEVAGVIVEQQPEAPAEAPAEQPVVEQPAPEQPVAEQPAAEVRGVQEARTQLPRTGNEVTLALVALGLMMAGAGALLYTPTTAGRGTS